MLDKSKIVRYVEKLLSDLRHEGEWGKNQELQSIYFGGGTPSLVSPELIGQILKQAKKIFCFVPNIEITLEANPGTIDLAWCRAIKNVGVNRISIGVQSFNNKKLKIIERIHDNNDICLAINAIKMAGFYNFNLDLMFGLPEQTVAEALEDLEIASSFNPPHLSWYHLTLSEPIFKLPQDEILWDIQNAGQKFLALNGLKQYEIAAYSSSFDSMCRHNINYWEYGDYIGIGAGAHSKLTFGDYEVRRYEKIPNPEEYIRAKSFIKDKSDIAKKYLPLEFMLNALRLYRPIPYSLFYERTGFTIDVIKQQLQEAQKQRLIELKNNTIITTERGKNFLNNLLELFL